MDFTRRTRADHVGPDGPQILAVGTFSRSLVRPRAAGTDSGVSNVKTDLRVPSPAPLFLQVPPKPGHRESRPGARTASSGAGDGANWCWNRDRRQTAASRGDHSRGSSAPPAGRSIRSDPAF